MRAARLIVLLELLALALILPMGTAAATISIPSLPTDLLSEPFSGAPAVPQPIAHQPVAQHPFLSPNGTNSMHNDAYASDSYDVSGPLGHDLSVRSASYGVLECATMAFDSRHRIIGLCGGLEGFKLKLIDPTTLHQISTLKISNRKLDPKNLNPFSDLCGGAYFYLDKHDRALVLTNDNELWQVDEVGDTFEHRRTYDLGETIPKGDCMIAVLPDWSGTIWFVTRQGMTGTINPDTGAVHAKQFVGETIANSFAVDESGGVYIATDHALYRMEATAAGVPRVGWRQTYDRGAKTKLGQLSQGSGTTPTLIGDDLVVITDNAEPRMNVLVYDRRASARSRLICKVPVFAAGRSATENSLAAAGNSVIVENNYGYKGPLTTILGRSTTPGIARVMIDDDGCHVAWTSDLIAPTSVPKTSLGNGLLYVYTKDATRNLLDDSWYFTAVDIRTGRTVWRQRTGNGLQWNNHYASIYLGPDGAAYMPTLAGLIRLADTS